MANYNKVVLMGNLTRDPQVRYTAGGTAVADIGLAVNRTWFDKQANQKKEETTFVDVTLWGGRPKSPASTCRRAAAS